MTGRPRKYKYAYAQSRICSIWRNMIARCSTRSRPDYKYYGGKGIKVCDRWKDFDCFYEDLHKNYQENLTLDRINTNGNYEPENCRWVTMKVQCNNKSNNILFNGETTSSAAKRLKTKTATVRVRITKYNWTPEKAFNTPVRVPRGYTLDTKPCELCGKMMTPVKIAANRIRRVCKGKCSQSLVGMSRTGRSKEYYGL